jgi:hypothetical protein
MPTSPSYQKLQAICKSSMLAENSNEADLASFTPSFLWLLRDFYLSLEEEGESVCVLTASHQEVALIHICLHMT